MTDTKALKELLPEIEEQEGQWPHGLLGRYLCAAHGWEFVSTHDGLKHDDTPTFNVHFYDTGQQARNRATSRWLQINRDLCPDVDLTAADKLCGELGYSRISGYSGMEKPYFAAVSSENVAPRVQKIAGHPTSELTAICLALARALIAEGEE